MFGFFKKPAAPKAPDPTAMADRTIGTNLFGAAANNRMQMMDQRGPFGSVTHTMTGTKPFTDPTTGRTFDVPSYRADTTMSPQERSAYNSNVAGRTAAGDAATGSLGAWWDATGGMYPGGEAIAERAAGMRGPGVLGDIFHRIRPEFERRRGDMEAKLAAGGVAAGTEAYGRGMESLDNAENDMMIEAAIRARMGDHQINMDTRRQAQGELDAEYRAPLSAFSALMGRSGAIAPNGQPVAPGGFSTPDMAALDQQSFANRLGIWDRRMTARDNALNALGDLGGNALRAWGHIAGGGKKG